MPRMARAVLPFGDTTQPCVTPRGAGIKELYWPFVNGQHNPLPCAGAPRGQGGSGRPSPAALPCRMQNDMKQPPAQRRK